MSCWQRRKILAIVRNNLELTSRERIRCRKEILALLINPFASTVGLEYGGRLIANIFSFIVEVTTFSWSLLAIIRQFSTEAAQQPVFIIYYCRYLVVSIYTHVTAY
jgi:hypothetical protein